MFIEITGRLSQAPPELGELLPNVFYKHYAPPALQNLGIRQRYPKPPRSKASLSSTPNLQSRL